VVAHFREQRVAGGIGEDRFGNTGHRRAVNFGISVSCSRQGYGFSGGNFGGEVVECCG
jgi:hypothetical protein